ncbi:energy coupling factor transporter S component ThiW [uncultured Anaerococcus sp.]|uniref:energy coupling factor transporter S component ThiW n=1 Tax=uncultured Anaerococcus sp. TaxID=293428 RepID=UPI0026354E68|nr:energy coupling factor transporter S component ThiW [uncultured Anaerococcus sp.]
MQNSKRLRRFVFLAMLVAIGVVISPILRVHGFAPMQHFINVICSVFLGPYYSLSCAFMIAILRMSLMGISPLALTGAVFGAYLSGLLYKRYETFISACIGEIIGTGIIGSMISFPVMKFVAGDSKVALFTFTPSFIIATIIGSAIAYIFLKALEKNGTLVQMKESLND